MEQAVA